MHWSSVPPFSRGRGGDRSIPVDVIELTSRDRQLTQVETHGAVQYLQLFHFETKQFA
jgi:hypothetical protein